MLVPTEIPDERIDKKADDDYILSSYVRSIIKLFNFFMDNNMANGTEKSADIVILIHGMSRTRFSMLMLDRYLKCNGYATCSFSYSSTKYTVKKLAVKFADFLAETAEKHPGEKIHIVSHSLGGIITREALVMLGREIKNSPKGGTPNLGKKIKSNEKNRQIQIGRIVMLAPPNKGSKAANFFSKIWPVPQILKPIIELRNAEDSPINDVPIPQNVDIGVIAGRFDCKVSPAESHLDIEKDHLIVNSAHTFIMNNRNVKIAVKNFLLTGRFSTKQ